MNSASEILVIILSIFLALFLVLGIALIIYLIKLTREIRDITKTAEHTITSVDSVVSNIAKFASPIFMAEMLSKLAKKFKKEKGE